jgi:FMN phosphatase YigB (HAD superfamily)
MSSFPPPNSTIELRAPLSPRPDIALIVFDFDGTLSWLRHGWPGMMCDAFGPHFPLAAGETREAVRAQWLSEILALNGQPSIKQCQRLVAILRERKETDLDPFTVRDDFQRRLDAAIARRTGRIQSGEVSADDYVIYGIHAFLAHAQTKEIEMAVLSTTAQERLEEELALLGLRGFFGRHIYGGKGDPTKFSKRVIFEQMLAEEKISGGHLLSFGDGPVELRDTKELGGVAVGVCTDEERNGSGECDPHKRTGLFAVGADVVIPDYRDAAPLLDYILGR